MRSLIIDADILLYTAAAKAEVAVEWEEDLWTYHAHMPLAKEHAEDMLESIAVGLKADRLYLAFTDSTGNFRKKVMPEYKRKRGRKPLLHAALREYLMERFGERAYFRPGLEGDDIMGILGTHPTLVPGERVLVTIDKDLRQIPGLHAKLKGYGEEGVDADNIALITKQEADTFFYEQCLSGDATDGYPGCPGIGPKTARELIADGRVLEPTEHTLKSGPRKGQTETRWNPGRPGSPWEIVVSVYKSRGLNEEVALQNARCARILRYTDYDLKKKEPILWSPGR